MRKTRILTALAAVLLLLQTAGAFADQSVLLTFTGDCTIGSEERTRAREDSLDAFAQKKGYDYFFAHFRELFEGDDQTIINFEGVLSDSAAQESRSKTYRFRAPTEFVKVLTGSSIEGCTLANNHTGDFGKQGEDSTKNTLSENGIAWAKGWDPLVVEKNGIKIYVFSIENRFYNEYAQKFRDKITELKQTGEANAVVVCWHTGLEYRGAHEPNTEVNVQRIMNAGADLVVINHPHVLQGIGVVNNRFAFYSLGNFVFGGNSKIETRKFLTDKTVSSLYTAVVQMKMFFTDDGRFTGSQATIFPAITSSANPVNNYQPYRANAEEAAIIRDALQIDTPFPLPEILTDENGYTRMELDYLPAFSVDGAAGGFQGKPESADPAPSRATRQDQ